MLAILDEVSFISAPTTVRRATDRRTLMARDGLGEFEQRVLLAILRLGSESYSVPIVLELEERMGKSIAPAAVYIALRRLEEKGLVASRMALAEDSGRERRYFKLEDEGLERLRESRRELEALWEGLDPVLDRK
jgi:DNA-binding PadR family transcriptional regulator